MWGSLILDFLGHRSDWSVSDSGTDPEYKPLKLAYLILVKGKSRAPIPPKADINIAKASFLEEIRKHRYTIVPAPLGIALKVIRVITSNTI